jgi:predicted esterase
VITEHHIPTHRTARYYTLGVPGPGIAEVWFALHGYGQLAGRFVRALGPLDNGSRLVVAPEALSRFYLGGAGERAERSIGASWMTREDRLAEIDDQIRYLDAVYTEVLTGFDRASVGIYVLGYSQGASAAARWLARGTARADRMILWGGEIPPDLDLAAQRERFSGLDLTLVAGTHDQFITSKILDREKQRLASHHIPFRLVTFQGGHEIDETVLRQVAG